MKKYRNIPTIVDGIRFDSKKEAKRYSELKILKAAGQIDRLQLQEAFNICVKNFHICKYIADFVYTEKKTGQRIVEDVKGVKTDVYKLKKRLMLAVHNISITEV